MRFIRKWKKYRWLRYIGIHLVGEKVNNYLKISQSYDLSKKWLLKTEPSDYSWDDLEQEGNTIWDGVRNFEAQNNLKNMLVHDLAFFYHTGNCKAVVGVVEVSSAFYYPDLQENRFGVVEVKCFVKLKNLVTLQQMKLLPELSSMVMFKQPRLSVVPISQQVWEAILAFSEIDHKIV